MTTSTMTVCPECGEQSPAATADDWGNCEECVEAGAALVLSYVSLYRDDDPMHRDGTPIVSEVD